MELKDEHKYPEFNVYVIKDEECTLVKKVRFEDEDIHAILVRCDVSHVGGRQKQWKQVQAIPAYALTDHKAQGLTLYTVYIGLDKVFGFGIAYTVFTRTKFEENMYNVGVPPKDILQMLLQKDQSGRNMIENKKLRVQGILADPTELEKEVDRRINSGEFDLEQLANDLSRGTPTSTSPTNVQKSASETQPCVRKFLTEQLRLFYQDWEQRLDTLKGLAAMCPVNTWDYSFKHGAIQAWENNEWKTLAQIFQQDSQTRQRILYYYQIVSEWLLDPRVDVLSSFSPETLATHADKRGMFRT